MRPEPRSTNSALMNKARLLQRHSSLFEVFV
jgi:hypothetical protein